MPKPASASATPVLVLERQITYQLGGSVTVHGTLCAPDPLAAGEVHRRGVPIALPQPKGAWTEAHILSAIQKQYPQCRVEWAPLTPDPI